MGRTVRFAICLLVVACTCLPAQTSSKAWLDKGVAEFKNARYPEAAEAFQKAVELSPNEVTPHLYLATVLRLQYLPGSALPSNAESAGKAESEFKAILRLDPKNKVALESLSSLAVTRAKVSSNPDQKLRHLDEAESWYKKLIAAYPRDREAWYSRGVVAWLKWYPTFTAARSQPGMEPEDPGPLTNAAVRRELRSKYWPVIEDGITVLKKAIDIDPSYESPMGYLNLLYRERAELRDTPEEYREDIGKADEWLQKALDIARHKAGSATVSTVPPKPRGPEGPRIWVQADVQQLKLIKRVGPVYPPTTIRGTIGLSVVIGVDGSVRDVQLVSGPPSLAQAAIDAVRQWLYQPTLLDGEPVGVDTTVDVEFSLP